MNGPNFITLGSDWAPRSPALAKCEICGREFSAAVALAQHMRDKHGGATGSEQPSQERPEKSKRKTLKKRNRHPVAIGIAAIAIAALVGIYFVAAPEFAMPPFQCTTDGSYIHLHPYLQIWVEGRNVTIPADVGIIQNGGCLQPVHTHDASGILHIELTQAEASGSWSLADFFTIWKFSCSVQPSQCPVVNGNSRPVVFNGTDILGFKTDATHQVTLLVDGAPSALGGSLDLEQYDYCSAATASVPPCSPTAGGDPAWNGAAGSYPYGTGHKIIIAFFATG